MRSLGALVGSSIVIICFGLAQAGIKVESLGHDQVEILVDLEHTEHVTDEQGNWLGVRLPDFYSVGFETLGVWVPVSAVLVGAPHDGYVTCEVIDGSWNEIPDEQCSEFLRRVGEKLSEMPGEPGVISSDGFYRHKRLVGIRISPLIWDRSSGKLKVFTSFKLRLGFSGSGQLSRSMTPSPGITSSNLFRSVLANYQQAENWFEPIKPRTVGDYFTSSSNWVKLLVDSTGIYCVTGRDLANAGVPILGADTRTFRLYSSGGIQLSESLADTNASWMEQVALLIRDGGDNRFDQGDSLIFYGLGLHDWADLYDPAIDSKTFFKHFYSTTNCYWLTWGGSFTSPVKRIQTRHLPGCDGCTYTDIKSFRERLHIEKDQFEQFSIRAEDGWYWAYLRPGTIFETQIPTPSCDNSTPAYLNVRVGSWEDAPRDTIYYYYYVRMFLNGVRVAANDSLWDARQINRNVKDLAGFVPISKSSVQTLRLSMPSRLPATYTGKIYDRLLLAWIEIFYDRNLEASNNSLFFNSPDSSGTFRFELTGFKSPSIYAFDVTDQFNVKRLEGFEISAGYKIAFFDTVSSRKRYAVVTRDAMLRPTRIEVASLAGIRNRPTREYCIITHRDVVNAAEMLASFHSSRGIATEVVTVDQIYDEFGWGIPDVTAIRDFLRWRYWHGDLGLVLLLGDATWDVMGRKGGSGNPNYVPTYERRFLPPVGDPYNTDDWFGYLEPSPGDTMARFPNIGVSRLPAISAQDAIDLVERTIQYMSSPELGIWQNRVILIADDDRVGANCDGIPHTFYAEQLSDEGIPPEFEQVKIYLTEYPGDISGHKTAARKDLVDNLNMGALITDFTGHGDPLRLTQEEVYNKATLSLINNGRRRTFLIAASCNVSRFDDLSGSSIAEDLLRRSEGGTIGSLGSTHFCTASENQLLNLNFLKQIFNGNFRKNPVPIGDAASLAKMVIVSSYPGSARIHRNNEMYALFGDAALTLAYPRYGIKFERSFEDTLQRRGSYSFVARIVDSAGNNATSFSGEAQTFVREAEDTTGYRSCTGMFFDYEMPGDLIFRGKASVTSGRFTSKFFISSVARMGPRATVRCFASDGLNSAIGLIDSLVIEGVAATDDNIGPEIEAFLLGKKIESGDTLMIGDRIEVKLIDSSGVALRGKSRLLPGVSALLDESVGLDLSDSLVAIDGDYTKWVTSFRVPVVPAGQHRLSLVASDNLGNMASKEYEIYVSGGAFEAANAAFVYPNPASQVCYIIWQYDCDPTTEIEIDVSIFTIAGRRVWKEHKKGHGPYQEIVWNCKDMAGDVVANGTYIAVVESRSSDGSSIRTSDRLVIMVAR